MTKNWKMSRTTDSETSMTRIKSYRAQDITDRNKTQYARENSQQKCATHRKVTTH
jgi:hypothetical protein